MEKLDVAIIGAGPSGIFCARRLASSGKKVALLEKSRNIGGRLASRRFDGHVFNFGVNSFHSTADELNEMVEHGIASETLIRDGVEVSATAAITDWTKGLVKGLDVRLGHLVEKIQVGDNENIITFSGSELAPMAAKDIIISAPAPQAAKILMDSGLPAGSLEQVEYSSAIYYMLSLKRELEEVAEFQIVQHVHHSKDDKHFYLLAFEEDWSEKSREELREEFDEVFRPIESHVHKWKYAKVKKGISSDEQMLFKNKGIFLTGDYFYGDNMDSAVLSAQGVLDDIFHV